MREDLRGLIDRAAKAHGKSRSDFMIEGHQTPEPVAVRRLVENVEVVLVAVRIDPDQGLVEQAVNLRMREDLRGLIDRAAKAHGKSRSDFMIEAARRACLLVVPS
jgi:uncharacterized protein (DUF1778 family)